MPAPDVPLVAPPPTPEAPLEDVLPEDEPPPPSFGSLPASDPQPVAMRSPASIAGTTEIAFIRVFIIGSER